MLEGDPRRRGPEAVKLQHHGGHERLHRLGQQRHAGHGGSQLRPQDGGGPALARHSGEDHAAGGRHQGGQRSPGVVTAAALASELQASKATYAAHASALAALLFTVDGLDAPLEVDTKIAKPSSQRSLLAGTPAFRRSRGPRPTGCWPCTPRTPRSQPSRPRSSGSSVICNLHLEASLLAALANGDDTLTADCYSIAGDKVVAAIGEQILAPTDVKLDGSSQYSFAGDQGAWSTAKMYFTVSERNCKAALWGALPGALPNGAHAHHIRQFSGTLQPPQLRGLGQLHGGRWEAFSCWSLSC